MTIKLRTLRATATAGHRKFNKINGSVNLRWDGKRQKPVCRPTFDKGLSNMAKSSNGKIPKGLEVGRFEKAWYAVSLG